ncbi:E3 ubiquitin-protein ligase TRIM45-like [Ylistrum balloti]|uniref:E3 ubiquitin-protein ligase TRIM45-like n=1 Tax=Ylistrum balloti TaxID=509963 RepID=UPI002905ABC0|nr:E3 ubiquitin-protein ligase TRIM45-like [Ylistrum balloti]
MEDTKTNIDFIDECVAELRLDNDVTPEMLQVTKDSTVRKTDGIKVLSNFNVCSEMTDDEHVKGVVRVTEDEECTTTVKSAIMLTLKPVTETSGEKIDHTKILTCTSTSYEMDSINTDSNRPATNGTQGTPCLSGDASLVHGDADTVCPVCGDSYKDPRILPCLHLACLQCIYTLHSTESQNGPGCSQEHQLPIHCPQCSKSDGVTNTEKVPPNAWMSTNTDRVKCMKENAREMRRLPAVICEFCCEEERAVAVVTCVDCTSDLCQLCSDSHKRQRKTRQHILVGIPFAGTSHQADDVSYDVMKLHELVQDASHRKDDIQKYLDNIPATRKELRDNAETVTKEIDMFMDSFVKAVEQHRKSLLQQVSTILHEKETKLQAQQDHLCRLLGKFENDCNIADGLSVNCTDNEISAKESTVSQRLKQLIDISMKECVPVETTFTFCRELKADVFENFQMFGRVQGSQACPYKCQVTTQDLASAKVDIPCTVILTTRDTEDEPFPNPPGLLAWVRCGINGRSRLPVTMRERSDAIYDLTFTPQQSGPHQLCVQVDSQDISGCPFKFEVKSKWREHSGTWHCCSFCSSAGRMDVPCGCGAVVRGSRGCWHAQPGYPGGPHWTCCGKISRQSQCIYAIRKHNSNVMEVTL